jgi:hypothetical protein
MRHDMYATRIMYCTRIRLLLFCLLLIASPRTVNAEGQTARADNLYCVGIRGNQYETTDFAPPENRWARLPERCVRTAKADTPQRKPVVKTVCPDRACDFRSVEDALNAANGAADCGWTIKVEARDHAGAQRIYSAELGHLVTKACSADNWNVVESDMVDDPRFPPEGNRITPCWIGKASLPDRPAYKCPAGGPAVYLPKLISRPTPPRNEGRVIMVDPAARYWRFIGLELATPDEFPSVPAVVKSTGDHIIFDRLIIHGGDNRTGQNRTNIHLGINFAESTYGASIDSYFYDLHCLAGRGGTCIDSQTWFLGGLSSQPSGPFKIVNNFSESAGSNLGAGGGGPGAEGIVAPTMDVEFRRNELWKPLFWNPASPSYFGTKFLVKNQVDVKNISRLLIEGNVAENDFSTSDQRAIMLILGGKNQSHYLPGRADSDGRGTLTTVEWQGHRGKFANHEEAMSQDCPAPGHCGVKYNDVWYQAVSVSADQYTMTLRPWPPYSDTVPPSGKALPFWSCTPGKNPNAQVSDIVVRYNRLSHAGRGLAINAGGSDCKDMGKGVHRITVHDNVFDDLNGVKWFPAAPNEGGYGVLLNSSPDNVGSAQPSEILIQHNTFMTYGVGHSMSGFMRECIGGAPQQKVTNIKVVDNLGVGVYSSSPRSNCGHLFGSAKEGLEMVNANWCFAGNVLATDLNELVYSNEPYNDSSSPGTGIACPNTVAGNNGNVTCGKNGATCFPHKFDGSHHGEGKVLEKWNGGDGGDYRIVAGSPYKNAGTDGKDVGADVERVLEYTAGVADRP